MTDNKMSARDYKLIQKNMNVKSKVMTIMIKYIIDNGVEFDGNIFDYVNTLIDNCMLPINIEIKVLDIRDTFI